MNVKVLSFSATEMGWLPRTDLAPNAWEHPDGTVEWYPESMGEPVITTIEMVQEEGKWSRFWRSLRAWL